VQYDQAAHETLQAAVAQDAECQQAFAEIVTALAACMWRVGRHLETIARLQGAVG
jgi:hypothetical protein